MLADVEIFNSDGQLAARLEGASCRRADPSATQERDGSDDCLWLGFTERGQCFLVFVIEQWQLPFP